MTKRSVSGPSGVYRSMHVSSTARRDLVATPVTPMGPTVPDATPSRPVTVIHDVSPPERDFTEFYRTAWPNVARALSVALGDRDLAVDATDEAMARAYPRWDKIRDYDNPAAWVYRVGLNWGRSYYRRLARRLPFSRPEAEELTEVGPVADPAIRQALLDLPLRFRTVVVCRLLLDWSVADTAAALGVRPGTVRSRLHRALQLLESSLHHLR